MRATEREQTDEGKGSCEILATVSQQTQVK